MGVSALGGVCSGGRGCLLWGVGGSALGGCLLPGGPLPGASALGGFASDMPPVNRITDMSKNITLATTSLRPVKILPWPISFNNVTKIGI